MSLLTALAAAIIGSALVAGPALAGPLNPEPGSPGIGSLGDLHTIIGVLAVILAVAFNVWLARSIRPRVDGAAVAERSGIRQGALVASLAVLALFVFVVGSALSHKAAETPASLATVAELEAGQPLEIEGTGQQWLWRFDYPNDTFSFRRLVVPTGVAVTLNLHSADVIHGWNVPSLTGKAQVVPGRTTKVHFRADEEGVHKGRASVLNGQGFSSMQVEVKAVSPADYESFIERQQAEVQAGQDAAQNSSDNS